MFEKIINDLDYYIKFYKFTILQTAFKSYINNNITRDEYYNYNNDYFDLIKVHNKLILCN